MPFYDIQNKKTGEVKEIFCSYSDREKALKEEGKDWEYIVHGINLSYLGTKSTLQRTDSGWKDTLSKISQAHPASKMASKHLRKTTGQIKTEQIMKKHKKKK
jgi:hypothetical protein